MTRIARAARRGPPGRRPVWLLLAAVTLPCVVGVASAAPSTEADGAIAPASRWSGPHGPPSRSRRSRALPVTRDVVQAWALELPGTPVSAPVTWDGHAFVLCTLQRGRKLLAIDIATGKVRASKKFPKALDLPIHVWNNTVYLATSTRRVSGYRLTGRSFAAQDLFNASEPSGVVAFENEIYIVDALGLARMASGVVRPVWRQPSLRGPMAIHGRSLVLWDHDTVVSVARRDGKPPRIPGLDPQDLFDPRGRRRLGREPRPELRFDGTKRRGRDVTLGAERILVQPGTNVRIDGPPGFATHVFVKFQMSDEVLKLTGTDGLWTFRTPAAVFDGGLLASDEKVWQLWKGGKGLTIASKAFTPDLFESIVPATVVGEVAYFGTWAADLRTGQVLWRLPLRSVLFGTVPGDGIFLVVDGSNTVRAYRSRVGS